MCLDASLFMGQIWDLRLGIKIDLEKWRKLKKKIWKREENKKSGALLYKTSDIYRVRIVNLGDENTKNWELFHIIRLKNIYLIKNKQDVIIMHLYYHWHSHFPKIF